MELISKIFFNFFFRICVNFFFRICVKFLFRIFFFIFCCLFSCILLGEQKINKKILIKHSLASSKEFQKKILQEEDAISFVNWIEHSIPQNKEIFYSYYQGKSFFLKKKYSLAIREFSSIYNFYKKNLLSREDYTFVFHSLLFLSFLDNKKTIFWIEQALGFDFTIQEKSLPKKTTVLFQEKKTQKKIQISLKDFLNYEKIYINGKLFLPTESPLVDLYEHSKYNFWALSNTRTPIQKFSIKPKQIKKIKPSSFLLQKKREGDIGCQNSLNYPLHLSQQNFWSVHPLCYQKISLEKKQSPFRGFKKNSISPSLQSETSLWKRALWVTVGIFAAHQAVSYTQGKRINTLFFKHTPRNLEGE